MASRETWDQRYLELAQTIAQWSKDPSTKTGAVIVNERNLLVSVGYNGFPIGVEDLPERWNDRETKYKIVVHCERNALLVAGERARGCRLYTWPFMSCVPCASMVIQAGIKEVVAPSSDNPRWVSDFELSKQLFSEAGVKVTLL